MFNWKRDVQWKYNTTTEASETAKFANQVKHDLVSIDSMIQAQSIAVCSITAVFWYKVMYDV